MINSKSSFAPFLASVSDHSGVNLEVDPQQRVLQYLFDNQKPVLLAELLVATSISPTDGMKIISELKAIQVVDISDEGAVTLTSVGQSFAKGLQKF